MAGNEFDDDVVNPMMNALPWAVPDGFTVRSGDIAPLNTYRLLSLTVPDWKIEGEADVGVAIGARAESLGWQAYDLSVLQPSYFPRMPNARARLSLVQAIGHAIGAPLSLGSLNEAVEVQARAVEEAFAAAEGMPELIRQLEQQYDSGVNRPDFGRATEIGELPATEDIMQEVERLFDQGTSGPADAD